MHDAAGFETGVLKTWFPDKGYGFVGPLDKSVPDAFFHISTLRDASPTNLERGMRVEYARGPGPDGRHTIFWHMKRPAMCVTAFNTPQFQNN